MNLINLKRIFNHILLNVSQENLEMKHYRCGDECSHECDSAGCVIGHCTILDEWENIPKSYFNGKIKFSEWSEQFTSLEHLTDNWNWCFGGEWYDNKNQILLRIKYLIDNQAVPEDWWYNWGTKYNYILPLQKLEPYEFD